MAALIMAGFAAWCDHPGAVARALRCRPWGRFRHLTGLE
jgi:hypothetical protein